MLASSNSIPSKVTRRDAAIVALAVSLVGAVYLLASRAQYSIGFPLDDSWIHQTYARNLALHGQWAFRLGIPSAGSTSPLWSALLAAGFILHLSPFIWTFFLGALTLTSLALVCEAATRALLPVYRPAYPWAALFIALEWHMDWSAFSGMETLLHALICTSLLILLITGSRRFLTLGMVAGLSVWIRPDGLTLLGPVAMCILLGESTWRSRLTGGGKFLLGFGALFVPYLLFNLALGGQAMPNTFYAKQAEYAAWQTYPLYVRFGELALQLFAGPALALVPGAILWVVKCWRARSIGSIAAIVWGAGYMLLYVLRLPVYQHGRYVMPAMPIFFLFGLLGVFDFILSARSAVARFAWRAAIAMLVASFVAIGARAYAEDVAIIQSEMVVTAQWAATNLPSGALIAAHDIGALGYYDNHPLIDLAGLVSPDVIPFIRDEARLARYLDERHAEYLIVFPDFYPRLIQRGELLFVTNSAITTSLGRQNMAVYRWNSP